MGQMIALENDGTFDNYLAAPPEGVPLAGALIVIHEIWGLVDHVKDVADRFAAEGYLALAPDLLGRVGIDAHLGAELQAAMFSPDENVRNEAQPRMREAMSPARAPEFADWAVPALQKCVDYLEAQPGVDGRLAVTGFCFGGSYSFALAAADRRIRVAIPFYGSPPESTAVAEIAGPVLAFYGERDERLIDSLPEVTRAMTEAGVDFTSKVYPGTGHAFFNDTNAGMYDADAATDAWRLTLAELASVLRA